MAEPESFGQRVKVLRRDLGLTQDELARRVGCAPVTLRKIEANCHAAPARRPGRASATYGSSGELQGVGP